MDNIKWFILQRCTKDRLVDKFLKESIISKKELKIIGIAKCKKIDFCWNLGINRKKCIQYKWIMSISFGSFLKNYYIKWLTFEAKYH